MFYFQLGKLKQAHEDLDKAIELEPTMLDAYWHRHLLFLLQNHKSLALEDLNFILKNNKLNSAAYRSRSAQTKHYSYYIDTSVLIILVVSVVPHYMNVL